MISIQIKELSKGYVVEYFDDKQPSEMDAENTWCEEFDHVLNFIGAKQVATMKWRKKEGAKE
jgi:hypothetical protein